ncbi:MAG: molybdopterin-dependent oxidoreductase [Burkholderiales bacterium]|nr:molybdopterin-dependent oxidoreductase [Burkholderiales bacterium]
MTAPHNVSHWALERRRFLRAAGGLAASAALGMRALDALAADTYMLPIGNGERPLVKYPQKRPLIVLTSRPPQLETPWGVFNEGIITPNDAFFVRYHLAGIPTEINLDTFRIEVKGKVNTPLTLSVADLKKFDSIEYVAVNQCSGNSRGFFDPRVAGGQLANGAMGNAKWRGVPLKAVLEKAGVQAGAKQVKFDGVDGPVLPATPDFVKALDVDHAMDGEVMIAYSMNDADLPMLNGYPVRLIVPGYFGTYWVKHLNEITVIDEVLNNFWMATAYRIPDNACACVPAGTAPKKTTPINRFDVRSFITNINDGARLKAGKEIRVRGIAFDGGYGIREVALSTDGGRTWKEATLGKDLGKYSFREWQTAVSLNPGKHELKVRAVNAIGQSQPLDALWNPAGYMRNVVETTHVTAA